jgi:hypothetical protein
VQLDQRYRALIAILAIGSRFEARANPGSLFSPENTTSLSCFSRLDQR